MIKHKFFTCHCSSEKCRYSRTNINSFLREYYKRNGEPLPPELQPTEVNGSAAGPVLDVKTEPLEPETDKKKGAPANAKRAKSNDDQQKKEEAVKATSAFVIPLTKVNVKAAEELSSANASKVSPTNKPAAITEIKKEVVSPPSSTGSQDTPSRPRRSLTRKTGHADDNTTTK